MKLTRRQLRKLIKEEVPKDKPPEKERIVDTIISKMETCGIIGSNKKKGLIDQIDNYDEFEDMIRTIVDAVGLPNDNNQIYFILKTIAEDFRDDPEGAVNMSKFNLSL